MTKAELATKLADKINIKKAQAEELINVFTEVIVDALARGGKVEIRGFGAFRTRERAAKMARNPKSGAKVEIPSKRVPFFRAGKDFKETLMGKKR